MRAVNSLLTAFLVLVALQARAQIRRGNDSVADGAQFAVLGDFAYFPAADGPGVRELWRTDGTSAGTGAVTQFGPGAEVLRPVAVAGRICFFVRRADSVELQSTDGQTSTLLRRVEGAFVVPNTVVTDGTVLWFVTGDATRKGTLWRSDGTAAGTIAVATPLPGVFVDVFLAGQHLYFVTESGSELWQSDGTPAGTSFVMRIRKFHGTFRNLGFFSVYNTTDGSNRLWRTDGTAAGTYPLAVTPDGEFAATRDAAYLLSYRRLVETDGTVAGTTDFTPPGGGHIVATPDYVYLYDYAGVWTLAGGHALMVLDLRNTYSLPPIRAFPLAGSLWFNVGERLWRINGAAAGPLPCAPIQVRPPSAVVELGTKAVLFLDDPAYGREPWVLDGVSGGGGVGNGEPTCSGAHLLANIYLEGTIRGTVTDAGTGKPLPDMGVRIVGAAKTYPAESFYASTGADGRYSLEGLRDGRYAVAFNPRYSHVYESYFDQWWKSAPCRAWYGCDAPPREATYVEVQRGEVVEGVDAALTRGGAISGRVTDANGDPVREISVFVADAFGGTVVSDGYSDGDGRYATRRPIPPGQDWVVYTSSSGYSNVIYDRVSCAAGCNRASAGTPVHVTAGQVTTGIDFTVRRAGIITGRFRDAMTGEPVIVAARVIARAPQGVVQGSSGTDGYTVRLPDGVYHLLVVPPSDEYQPAWYPGIGCNNASCSETGGQGVQAAPGETLPGYDVFLTPIGGRITGRVTDGATGTPLGGVRVHVSTTSGREVAVTDTAADGTYSTRPTLKAGAYAVRVDASRDRPGQVWNGTVTIAGTRIVRGVEFALGRRGTVWGTVTDAVTGAPLASARIAVAAEMGAAIGVTVTDRLGRYEVPVPEAATYVVTAGKRGYTTTTQTLTSGGEGRADFRLQLR
jgi:ELWxxDGT repeat protein